MDIDTYEKHALAANYIEDKDRQLEILYMGLIGELGSLLSEYKKTLRYGQGNRSKIKYRLTTELGDTLWYLTALAGSQNLSLRHDIIKYNVKRLVSAQDPNNQLPLFELPEKVQDPIEAKLKTYSQNVPKTFDDFQEIATLALKQEYRDNIHELFARLIDNAATLVGDLAQVITNNHQNSNPKKSLGDILWYLAIIAKVKRIRLDAVADANHEKTSNRWRQDAKHTPLPDRCAPPEEQFPRHMTFLFKETENEKVVLRYLEKNLEVGDALTDNYYEDDGYRFHDVFHLAYVAILGWSPVIRHLLKTKRKSDSEKDMVEDGARARIIDEAIAKIVHAHGKDIDPDKLLAGKKYVSTEILDQIQIFVENLEVDTMKPWEWEIAIIRGHEIYNDLRENRGGTVKLNLEERTISYAPPK